MSSLRTTIQEWRQRRAEKEATPERVMQRQLEEDIRQRRLDRMVELRKQGRY